MHAKLHTHAHTLTLAHLHTHTHMQVGTDANTRTHTRIPVHTCTYIYTHALAWFRAHARQHEHTYHHVIKIIQIWVFPPPAIHFVWKGRRRQGEGRCEFVGHSCCHDFTPCLPDRLSMLLYLHTSSLLTMWVCGTSYRWGYSCLCITNLNPPTNTHTHTCQNTCT